MGIDRLTMFLTNKWNIKEVLLFPAMKPTDDQAIRLKEIHQSKDQDQKVSEVICEPVFASNSTSFSDLDLASPEGLATLSNHLENSIFLGGDSPSADDSVVYEALSRVPPSTVQGYPLVNSFVNSVAMFSPVIRASWQ